MMSLAQHEAALNAVSVSLLRKEVTVLSKDIADTANLIPYSDWWARVGPLKGIDQWKTKLTTLGLVIDPPPCRMIDVGNIIFRYLNTAGKMSAQPLQTSLSA